MADTMGYVCTTCLTELTVIKTSTSYSRTGERTTVVFLGECPVCKGVQQEIMRGLEQQIEALRKQSETPK